MEIAIVTGSAGLIGSEAVKFMSQNKIKVVGIDNDMRKKFFGVEASTKWKSKELKRKYKDYEHYSVDIRDVDKLENIFKEYNTDIKMVLHAAAQPSHDWAAIEPITDFGINANGTHNLLELTKKYCSNAVFLFLSTNKVYGDTPNRLPLVEKDTRWEINESHRYHKFGIDEHMSVDQTKHSLFGVSKLSADLLVQEYGRYFGLRTGVFRGGCLTGPSHSGAQLHGFLAYLMMCNINGERYTVFGYKGKQVRDNIHCYDLVNMLWHFYKKPRIAEVYNVGGSRYSNCSMLEAIDKCEDIVGKKLNWAYSDKHRIGDHIWYISDIRKFQQHYPDWKYEYDLTQITEDVYNGILSRLNK